jgi:penicillin amidase
VYSLQAEAFMKILSPLLPDTPAGNILKTWDFHYDAESTGAWLFERFYKALHLEVFGENGFGRAAVDHLDRHTGIFNDFYVNFDRVLLSENSAWFDGKTREEIYAKAAEKMLMIEPRKWGDDQKLMLTHILFDGKLPKFLGFDRGPVTVIGNRATIHQGQIYESAGRKTSFAPSYRMVTDFAKDEIFTNMAGGPSDRRFSKWYCSDLENWETGKYKRLGPDPGEKGLKFP